MLHTKQYFSIDTSFDYIHKNLINVQRMIINTSFNFHILRLFLY